MQSNGLLAGAGLAAALCVSCGGSQQMMLGHPMHEQVAIMVNISKEVNQADTGGGVATLAETVSDGLKEHGINSQIYASKYDHPKGTRVELNVLFWDGPGVNARKFDAAGYVIAPLSVVGVVTGTDHVIVDCRVFAPGRERPLFHRVYDKTHLPMMLTATDDNGAAISAGDAIVDDLVNEE